MIPPKPTVIGCRALEEEVRGLLGDSRDLDLLFLPPALHRYPKLLTSALQEKIDELNQHAARVILLGYGLCGRGVEGIRSRDHTLIAPRCHDCITIFLGGPMARRRLSMARPRAFFLSASWIRLGMDPLSLLEGEYTYRVGRRLAKQIMKRELASYTHIIYIKSPLEEGEILLQRARDNALFFEKQLEEVQGSLDFLRRLLYGPHDEEEFVIVPPGGALSLDPYLGGLGDGSVPRQS